MAHVHLRIIFNAQNKNTKYLILFRFKAPVTGFDICKTCHHYLTVGTLFKNKSYWHQTEQNTVFPVTMIMINLMTKKYKILNKASHSILKALNIFSAISRYDLFGVVT